MVTRPAPIEFWFDFSSGYAYLAAQEIDALGQRVGRGILWRPYMLGAAFKVTGMRGLSSTPMKSGYARHDWARAARRLDIPFNPPEDHPRIALAATRTFYWLEACRPDLSGEFARTVFRAYYSGRLDTSDMEQVSRIGEELGIEPDALYAGAQSPEIKRATKEVCDAAIARGVFGSPFFLVDGEPFWGWDRMAMMEDWIRTGGW